MDWVKIRDALSHKRKSLGLTLTDVAIHCDTSPGYIHDIESGRTVPSVQLLEHLTQYLGIELSIMTKDDLLGVETKK